VAFPRLRSRSSAFYHVHYPFSTLISSLFLNHHLYADDTQLFSFYPANFDSSVSHLQNALHQISSWMTAKHMSSDISHRIPLRSSAATAHALYHVTYAYGANFPTYLKSLSPVGGRPLQPEILPPSDLLSPVNGILWEMSELITQERIAVGSSNLVEG